MNALCIVFTDVYSPVINPPHNSMPRKMKSHFDNKLQSYLPTNAADKANVLIRFVPDR